MFSKLFFFQKNRLVTWEISYAMPRSHKSKALFSLRANICQRPPFTYTRVLICWFLWPDVKNGFLISWLSWSSPLLNSCTPAVRAHRTSKLYSQIDCAASVGQCKTLSNLKSRCYICKEHAQTAEKMVNFEIWISRPWLWLVDSNFWFQVFDGFQE